MARTGGCRDSEPNLAKPPGRRTRSAWSEGSRQRGVSQSNRDSMHPVRRPIVTSEFFWRETARMRRQKRFSELQRNLTQIPTLLTVRSGLCCKNSGNILGLRTNSDALSRLILPMKSPLSISTERQVAQRKINRESLRRRWQPPSAGGDGGPPSRFLRKGRCCQRS